MPLYFNSLFTLKNTPQKQENKCDGQNGKSNNGNHQGNTHRIAHVDSETDTHSLGNANTIILQLIPSKYAYIYVHVTSTTLPILIFAGIGNAILCFSLYHGHAETHHSKNHKNQIYNRLRPNVDFVITGNRVIRINLTLPDENTT